MFQSGCSLLSTDCPKPVSPRPPTSDTLHHSTLKGQVKLVFGAPAAIHCLLRAKQPRPCSPEFADCLSILTKTHSAGIFFQHKAISPVICLLSQGPLSIEHILWRQQEITSNSVSLSVCGGLREKFISTTVFFQRLNRAASSAAVCLNKACLPAAVTHGDPHTVACGQTHGSTGGRCLNEQVKLINSRWFQVVLHLCSLFVDIFCFLLLRSHAGTR